MGDDERDRVRLGRTLVNEMDVEAVDDRLVLIERVQPAFLCAPVEFVAPISRAARSDSRDRSHRSTPHRPTGPASGCCRAAPAGRRARRPGTSIVNGRTAVGSTGASSCGPLSAVAGSVSGAPQAAASMSPPASQQHAAGRRQNCLSVMSPPLRVDEHLPHRPRVLLAFTGELAGARLPPNIGTALPESYPTWRPRCRIPKGQPLWLPCDVGATPVAAPFVRRNNAHP